MSLGASVMTKLYKLTDEKVKKQIDELTVGYSDKVQYYLDRFSYGVAQLAAAFYPHEVILRFSDFKTNEYANLIGKQVLYIVNLEPRTIKGVESNGMLMAVMGKDDKPIFLIPEEAVDAGSKIR